MLATTASSPDSGDATTPNNSNKRKQPPLATGTKPSKKVKRVGPRDDPTPANGDDSNKDGDAAGRPKRTRTGCLTCRERHLKCDEGLPACNNCLKSNRACKRGIRLNFIDIMSKQPPRLVTKWGTRDWRVEFLDESREIASEYEGGEERYKTPDELDFAAAAAVDAGLSYDFASSGALAAPMPQHKLLPAMQDMMPADSQQLHDANQMYDPRLTQAPNAMLQLQMQPQAQTLQQQVQAHAVRSSSVAHSTSDRGAVTPRSVDSFSQVRIDTLPAEEDARRELLDNPEEMLFMQVFVEEVGLWMDSMDPHKHFSRILPFHAMSEPMLLNAFLACGARHLALVNPVYTEEKALHYYDTATRYLLKNLQNPDRDTVVCATTAVILNVYEIMSERAMQRMNHIAGARALIKECGWNARSRGIGSACFWLNIGLEVLSCLHFNWQVAWDPDEWGVDMDFTRELHTSREEVWTHRMLYLIGKVCNYRATLPHYENELATSRDPQLRTQQRFEEWMRLRSLLESWNNSIPRTMQPLACVAPYQTASQSAFPEIWMVKRSAIVARLLYHTAMLLLAQTNPYYPPSHFEMADMQYSHATTICGLVVHLKDRGVASVAIRSLAHAAEVLKTRREQEEVVRTFEKINRETGWRIGFVYIELMEKWGWAEEPSARHVAQTHTAAKQKKMQTQQLHRPASIDFSSSSSQQQQQQHSSPQAVNGMTALSSSAAAQPSMHRNSLSLTSPPQPQQQQRVPKKMPQGITNPLYAKADFNLPQHPYQNFYVAPSTPMHAGANMLNGHAPLYYGT